MPSFTDSLGRSWSIDVNYRSVKTLRDELNVDLLSVVDRESDLLQRLATDEVLLVDVISVLLSAQITKIGLSVDQFAEGMLGEGLQRAVDSLVEGIANFSLPQKGAVIRKTWQMLTDAQKRASDRLVSSIDPAKVAGKVDAIVDSALKTLND